MSEELPVWCPVPLRWRVVQPGDVIVGTDGHTWSVGALGPAAGQPGGLWVATYCGTRSWQGAVDLDAVVNVLVPAPERDALTTTRDVLAARIIERRAG